MDIFAIPAGVGGLGGGLVGIFWAGWGGPGDCDGMVVGAVGVCGIGCWGRLGGFWGGLCGCNVPPNCGVLHECVTAGRVYVCVVLRVWCETACVLFNFIRRGTMHGVVSM